MVSMQGLLKNTVSISRVKRILLNSITETFKLSLRPIKLDEAKNIDKLVKSQTPFTQLPYAYAHNCEKKESKNFPIGARLSQNAL